MKHPNKRISVVVPINRTNGYLAEFNSTRFHASKYKAVALVYKLHEVPDTSFILESTFLTSENESKEASTGNFQSDIAFLNSLRVIPRVYTIAPNMEGKDVYLYLDIQSSKIDETIIFYYIAKFLRKLPRIIIKSASTNQ